MYHADPAVRLHRFQAEQVETDERQARILEALQSRQRVRNVWIHLEGRDNAELTPDRLARWLVTLAKVLAGFGMASRPAGVEPKDDVQKEALYLLELASRPQARAELIEGLAERLRDLSRSQRTWGRLLRCLKTWLQAVVLGEEPPPEALPVPPDGWEGPYPKAVEDLPSLCDWLDSTIRGQECFLPLSTLGHEAQRAPSPGRVIRNAYRLIDKLGLLAEMPGQPDGPLTVAQETAKLRNLKRVALRLLQGKSVQGSRPGRKRRTRGQGAGGGVVPPQSGSRPPEGPPPPLSPEVRAILARAKADQKKAAADQAALSEQEERRRRAVAAWERVRDFRDDAVPSDLQGGVVHREYAERIVELGQVLKADGWRERLDAIPPGPDAKAYAKEVLRRAMAGDLAAVTKMVQEMVDILLQLGLEADQWLREGLMHEILDIRPSPVPPPGWEGLFAEPIETVADFIKWIDQEFVVHDLLSKGQEHRASDGRLVRNAFRVVTQLNLPGMPLEPQGPFHLYDELTILRNLKRSCIALVDGGAPHSDRVEPPRAGGLSPVAPVNGEMEGALPTEERTIAAGDAPKLSPSRGKAYQQFSWAVRTNAELDGATDREVYDWLAGHLDEGERLPPFTTWSRYIRNARAAYRTGKYSSRAGRETGRSVVRPDQI